MTRRPKWINGAFVAHNFELVLSPTWRLARVPLRRVLERLEIEHMRHGGKLNGFVSYDQFVQAGISRRRIAATLILGEKLGLIKTVRAAEPLGDLRAPNTYRLELILRSQMIKAMLDRQTIERELKSFAREVFARVPSAVSLLPRGAA